MRPDSIGILETGIANTASVRAAISRLALEPVPVVDAGAVRSSLALVVPGVGAFGAAMTRIDALRIRDALRDRIRAGAPTLCICLGMQILFEASDEDPSVQGLALVPGRVCRFGSRALTPQLGWNHVRPSGRGLVRPGSAYFANSFRAMPGDGLSSAGWALSTTDHDGEFLASIERGPVLACQFHPELSGPWGAGLLRRWAERAGLLTPKQLEGARCSRRA